MRLLSSILVPKKKREQINALFCRFLIAPREYKKRGNTGAVEKNKNKKKQTNKKTKKQTNK
jgi:hypothetical protein